MRGAIRKPIETSSGLSVCGEAENGLEALQKARARCCDVVLLDLAMPGLNGIETAKILRLEVPHIKLVGFSMLANQFREELLASNIFDAVLSKTDGLICPASV